MTVCLTLDCAAFASAQPARRVVIIDLDGTRRDLFDEAYLGGGLPNFERILGQVEAGRGYSAAQTFEQATAVFPSVTMAGQAAIYTGAWPGRHGVVGNQWFDRTTGAVVDYMTTSSAACVYGFALSAAVNCEGGLANSYLGTQTLYEAATLAGKRSMPVWSQYWKGATHPVLPSLFDALLFTDGDSIDDERFDTRMTDRALEALGRYGLPDILTVYFTGTDGVAHAQGARAQIGYLQRVVDYHLGRLLDAIEGLDPEWRASTLFAITADHGRTDSTVFPDDRFAAAQVLAQLPRAKVVANGGMAHVYLPGRDSWAQFPASEDTMAAARNLYRDALLGRVTEYLFLRQSVDTEYLSYAEAADGSAVLAPVPDRVAVLVQGLRSARSGDIVIALKVNHYFGNTAVVGSHHGSIHDLDLAVPLLLGQGGIVPGRSGEPVSTTQLARTLAGFLGFAMEDAQPALPGVRFELQP